jgi:hypothetical protein
VCYPCVGVTFHGKILRLGSRVLNWPICDISTLDVRCDGKLQNLYSKVNVASA